MNIFALHKDPAVAAEMQCDKHIVKMPLETAQMMASAMRRQGATDIDMPLNKSGMPYGNAHPHHPCTLWAGELRSNFRWLAKHGLALCAEYTTRYGKVHACQQAILHMTRFEEYFPGKGSVRHSPFAQAMPDEFKMPNAIDAYRRYYLTDKAKIAKWNRGRPAPDWWTV
tara:strand:- start:773 stop:1279 length:507 start_codon:yes stop_codon:yes gene_type:complete